MSIPSTSPLPDRVFQEVGSVTRDLPLQVRTPSGTFDARRAASCLLQPAHGDTVLLAVPSKGELYVLAILERAETETSQRLVLDGDVDLVTSGELTLRASRIGLRAVEELELVSQRLRTSAVSAEVSADRLDVVTRAIHANATTLKSVMKVVDSVAERVSQRAKTAYRYIEGLDMTRAGEVDLRAAKTVNVRGENAFVSAEELVKVQGEQIHLG